MSARVCIACVVVLAACDGGANDAPVDHDTTSANDTTSASDTTSPGDDTSAPEDVAEQVFPPPPEGGQQLLSEPYTLQPGEEKYFCYTFTSPSSEVGVVAVDNIAGKLVHHVALFQTLLAEPEGFSECNVLVRLTWQPIWAGGRGGNGLELPPKVAFHIPGQTQYLVQYHLLNATPHPVTERSAINLGYAQDDLAGYEKAGIFALGQFSLNIPKDASGYTQEVGCSVEREDTMHVFAVFPHMHTLGSKLELFQGPSEDDLSTAYKIDPWPFGDQPFDRVDFDVAPGDYLRSRCTWNNTSGHAVAFGESTNDEMCFLVLFAYPMPEIDGCGF